MNYKAAADELRATTTAYRTMMGRWLVDTSKRRAESPNCYTWVIPPGTYILPPGEVLYCGIGSKIDGEKKVTLVCDRINPFATWPPLPPYDWSEFGKIEHCTWGDLKK